jgi:hypothetical protein
MAETEEYIKCDCGLAVIEDEFWTCETCGLALCLYCHEGRAWGMECDGCMTASDPLVDTDD